MSDKYWISKGDLLSKILQSDATAFVGFLLTPDGAVIGKMLELTSGIELDEPLVQNLMSQLLAFGVVTQASIDRATAWVAEKTTHVSPPVQEKRTYIIDTPTGVVDIPAWVAEAITPIGSFCAVSVGVGPLAGKTFVNTEGAYTRAFREVE